MVNGREGRTAVRHNLAVTTDYRNVHRRWTADTFEKPPISCRVIKQADRFTLMEIKRFTIPVAVTMAHMQINLFTIPVGDSGSALQEMNSFLKAHKIPEIQQNMISNNKKANGCYCVRFIDRVLSVCAGRRVRGHQNDFFCGPSWISLK